MLIAGSLAGIIGIFIKQMNTAGRQYFQGLGAGILIVLSFDVVPILIKKKNETTSR